jgi:polar amino acid transport system substrate-binding protein
MARSDWAIFGVLALGALLSRLAVAEALPLNVAYTLQNEPPYVLMSGGEVSAGLIHDIGVELAASLQRRPVFVLLSRNRIEAGLFDGTADLYCGLNPAWVTAPDQLRWSPPLFEDQDIFVLRAGDPPIRDWPDLRGRRVGTILGYHYAPPLMALFADGSALRDDAQSLASNFERLDRGWIDTVLASELVTRYRQHLDPRLLKYEAAPLIEASNSIYCAAADRAGSPAAPIVEGLAAMRKDGRMEAILARYR